MRWGLGRSPWAAWRLLSSTEEPTVRSSQKPLWATRQVDKRLSWRGWRQRAAINTQMPCEVSWCEERRRKLGRYCGKHRQAYEATGHPEAPRCVSRSEWGPLVETAAAFVAEQLLNHHPSMRAGVAWADHELAHLPMRRNTDACERLTRVRDRGLDGRELIARLIAAHLSDDRGQAARPRYRSDHHFSNQAGRLLLHRDRIGRMPWRRVVSGRCIPLRRYNDPCASSRLFAFHHFSSALGRLAMIAAEELRRRQSAAVFTPTKGTTP